MYYPILDLLRFIAAVAVVCHHYFVGSGNIFSVDGYLGVPLFFIISGFVIYKSFKDGEIKEYALSRFMRIYPLFWVCCTITYIITRIFSDSYVSIKTYLLNLLIVGNYFIIPPIDNSYWTLPFEIIFYFSFGLFVFLFTKKNAIWFFTIWILLTFFCYMFSLQNLLIAKILLLRTAPYFCFGGILAIITDSYKKVSLNKKTIYLAMFFLCAYIPLLINKRLDLNIPFGTPRDAKALLISYSFFIITPLAIYFSSCISNKKILKIISIIGGITYPLYLLHQKIGSTLMLYINEKPGEVTLASIWIAIIVLASSYILSVYEKTIRKNIILIIKSRI